MKSVDPTRIEAEIDHSRLLGLGPSLASRRVARSTMPHSR
jgi:hypothetical protein